MEDDKVAVARAHATIFLKNHFAGVIATVAKDGAPHASAIYYAADDNFNIYFMTLMHSRKFAAITSNPKVAFTIGTIDEPQTLQIEGVAMQLQHEEEMHAHIPDLVSILTSNSKYFAPIARLDPSSVALMWIEPHWIRWADYTSPEKGDAHVFTELSPVLEI